MKNNTRKLVLCALFSAITVVATLIIRIPSPLKGYVNLGDSVVLLCGWMFGGVYGFLGAGIGSALADFIAGYAVYAPATFVIKGIMAALAYVIYKALSRKKLFANIVSGFAAEALMVLGYFAFESILYGTAGAALNIIANCVQGAFGIAIGTLSFWLIKKRNIKWL